MYIFCFSIAKAQNTPKEAIVTMQIEALQLNREVVNKTDTFFVRSGFVLEPIKVNYAAAETDLGTGVSRTTAAEKRLQSYNLIDYQEMIGMSFDTDTKPTAKTIETYRVADASKRGIRFINEPYLINGLNVSDLIKDKDTIVNGAKCLLLKNNKVITSQVKGSRGDKILQVKILINPALKSYSYPFISEKIVEEFGGGAILGVAFLTGSGLKTIVRYTYSPFSSAETGLFNKYQDLYHQHIALLDKLKQKK